MRTNLAPECRTCRSRLSAYAEKDLAGAAAREVENHLLECGLCRRELQALEGAWQALALVGGLEVSPGQSRSLAARISQGQPAPGRKSLWSWILRPAYPALALALVLLMLVGAWMLRIWTPAIPGSSGSGGVIVTLGSAPPDPATALTNSHPAETALTLFGSGGGADADGPAEEVGNDFDLGGSDFDPAAQGQEVLAGYLE